MVDDLAAEHGRGLLLVRGLSLRTGVVGDHRGRLMWADIAWKEDAAPIAPSEDPYEAMIREGQAALAHRFATIPVRTLTDSVMAHIAPHSPADPAWLRPASPAVSRPCSRRCWS